VAGAEERRLRAYVRDLVALSTLSGWWIERPPSAIAESLRDLIASMLHPDVVRVRLREAPGGRTVTAVMGPMSSDGEEPPLAAYPLGAEGELGLLEVGWRSADFPTPEESALLRVAANHVAVALQHSALLRSHEAAERLLAVHGAQQAAVAGLQLRALEGVPVGRIFEEAVAAVRGTLEVDCAELQVVAPDGQSLVLEAGAGWPSDRIGVAVAGVGTTSQSGYTLSVTDPVIVPDLRRERRFSPSPLFQERGIVSGISVTVHDHDRPFGVLGAHACAPRAFTPNEVQFLQSIAHLLSAVLQRHRVEEDRQALLRQAQHAVQARDRAVGIVSHDLGNLLSTIELCAAALLDPAPPPPAGARDMAGIIQRSASWMQQIVRDLLDRASLDAGRLVLERRPTVVGTVIDDAYAIFAPVADEHLLELAVESPAGLPRVDADPRRLLQILSNLVSNAVKFTPAGGRVMLSAVLDGAAVRFAVRDSGEGIAAEDLPHVCDWYWHARRGKHGGTGLGLAIAQDLVQAHGGALRVESALGSGSTFSFTIPVVG
jgi:signal transduction histidine kinase